MSDLIYLSIPDFTIVKKTNTCSSECEYTIAHEWLSQRTKQPGKRDIRKGGIAGFSSEGNSG
ncbi:hypothetical protein PRIPAC_70170 [Pristionchus pacificus]|uniref:Uncharacterized protein n=1 Tax=Pristionchus pacificus TaxID=54126 RepID=A0A2A6CFU2_PRIPA|nr:hypothetical protein PRIPAC_70170 [Pristionchus pacificus]|eukprot:PDM76960.1 hypothetical protein PRIPAC_42355 [Pristionchus pacificus]